jgi:hypothetical protein
MDRKSARGNAPAPSRRTPVKAPSGGQFPWMPVGIAVGAIAVIGLFVYLIFQSATDSGGGLNASQKAEQDSSASLPGTFVPSQGRGHFDFAYSQERPPTPFCAGVESSDRAKEVSQGATGTGTATGATTPQSTPTPDNSTPLPTHEGATAAVPTDCYNSNPPSSGEHLNVQGNVEIADGIILPRIPPDPNVYPPDVFIPREAIPHILEHAGVFVGYNCADGDQQCQDVVAKLTDLVNDRIDNHDDRVVMANDPDLPVGTIGLSAWTRVLNMKASDYDENAVEDFIGTHACRFDPEGFC